MLKTKNNDEIIIRLYITEEEISKFDDTEKKNL